MALSCSCKDNAITRYDYNMKKYVALPEKISTDVVKTKDFEKFFDEFTKNAVMNKGVSTQSTEAEATEGSTVGITINSAASGAEQAELTVGDKTFKYGNMSAELTGKKGGDVFEYVFESIDGTTLNLTVTVDYVRVYELNNSTAQLMGYSDKKDAENKLKLQAEDEFIINSLVEKSEIKEYPEKEYIELFEARKNYYTQLASAYGNSLDEYLKKENITKQQFEVMLDKHVKETIKKELPVYAYARLQKIKLTQEDINKKAEEIAKQNGGTATEVFEQTPLRDIELLAVKEAVLKVIKEESK